MIDSSPYPPAYPPSYPTGGGAPSTRLRGRKPLWAALIAFVIAVILVVGGGVVVGTKALGKVNSFGRVSIASGSGTVTLNGAGKWIVYYEADNVSSSIDTIPPFHVTVAGPSGQNVTVQLYGNPSDNKIKKLTYSYNGHKGAAIYQFIASQSGTYTIRPQAVGSLPAGADVAIGRDIESGTVVGGLLILGGVLFLIAAFVLLILGLVKRSRHKKERATGGYGGYPPPGYAPQQQWPAQPTAPGQQWPTQQEPWPTQPPPETPQGR